MESGHGVVREQSPVEQHDDGDGAVPVEQYGDGLTDSRDVVIVGSNQEPVANVLFDGYILIQNDAPEVTSELVVLKCDRDHTYFRPFVIEEVLQDSLDPVPEVKDSGQNNMVTDDATRSVDLQQHCDRQNADSPDTVVIY